MVIRNSPDFPTTPGDKSLGSLMAPDKSGFEAPFKGRNLCSPRDLSPGVAGMLGRMLRSVPTLGLDVGPDIDRIPDALGEAVEMVAA